MSLSSIFEAPAWVASAIKKASQTTGADFDYLLKTAARESGFDHDAKAPTSSATGLFQFIENTWLSMVKEVGPQVGLSDYASAIQQTKSGRSYVPDAQARAEILNLRNDPEISAIMAGAFTQQNASYLAERLGRQPTEGELYIAHFLGPGNGARFVRLAETRPDLRADVYFARAARANRSIFYADGKPRTVGQVYDNLVSKFGETPVAVATTAAAAPNAPARKPDASKPPESTPLIAETKVAALVDTTPRFEAAKVLDTGLGSIGQWQTLVLPAGADVTSGVKAASDSLAAAKTTGAVGAAGAVGSAAQATGEATARTGAQKDGASAPVNAPQQARKVAAGANRTSRANTRPNVAAPTRLADNRPFAVTYWETRLANH